MKKQLMRLVLGLLAAALLFGLTSCRQGPSYNESFEVSDAEDQTFIGVGSRPNESESSDSSESESKSDSESESKSDSESESESDSESTPPPPPPPPPADEEVDIPPTITPVLLPEIGSSFVKFNGEIVLTPMHPSVINNGEWGQLLGNTDYMVENGSTNFKLHQSAYEAFLKMARDFKSSTKGNLEGDRGDQLVVSAAALVDEAYTKVPEKYRAGNLIKLMVYRLSFTWDETHGGMYSYEVGSISTIAVAHARVKNAAIWLENYSASYGFIAEGTSVQTYRYVGVGMANALRLMKSENESAELDDLITMLKSHTKENTYRIKDKNLNTTFEMWYVPADGDGNAILDQDSAHTTVYYYTGDGYIACAQSR